MLRRYSFVKINPPVTPIDLLTPIIPVNLLTFITPVNPFTFISPVNHLYIYIRIHKGNGKVASTNINNFFL